MKMKIKNKLWIGMFLLIGILMVSFSSAYMSSNVQYTQPGSAFSTGGYWQPDRSMCEAGQDFVIQIAPLGCTPAIVRSDLLEEQNVPVFCQLGATKINPLIKVEAIESISFSGKYPKEVSGVGFLPARAALGVSSNLNSPVLNNIGSVVIVLKEQENESAMPDFVDGNLTAKIKYDIKNAFGIGKASFYLPEMNDNDWEEKHSQYGFWDGRFYLRAEAVDEEGAAISVYDDTKKISGANLRKGETSGMIYLPGFDCLAGLQLKLDGLEDPDTRAKLNINGQIVEVADGEKFLENRCLVKDIDKKGIVQEVTIRCNEDEGSSFFGSKSFELRISPKVKLDFEGANPEGYEVGERLPFSDDLDKYVYVGYIGTKGDSGKEEDLRIRFVQTPYHGERLSDSVLSEVARYEGDSWELQKGNLIKKTVSFLTKKLATTSERIVKFLGTGTEMEDDIDYSQTDEIYGTKVTLVGFAGPRDEGFGSGEIIVGVPVHIEELNVDEMYNLLDIQFGEGVTEKDYSSEIKGVLQFLLDGFGSPYFTEKMDLKILSTWDTAVMEWSENVKRVIKVGDIDVKMSSERDRLTHELFHAFYQTNDFIKNNNDLTLEGLAIHAEYKYQYGSDADNKINEYLDSLNSYKPSDLNKNFNQYTDRETDYMYVYAGSKFVGKTKGEIRNILDEGIPKETKIIEANELKEYYQNAMKDYDKVINSFSSEKLPDGFDEITFGEEALYKKIELASETGQKKTAHELCEEFREGYPDSKKILKEQCDDLAKLSSSEISSIDISINGRIKRISFEDIIEPSFEEYSVDITITGADKDCSGGILRKNDNACFSNSEFIVLKELYEDYALFDVSSVKESTLREVAWKKDHLKINLNDFRVIGENNYQIRVNKINLKKLAKVSVNPNINNAGTEANFSFRIGIEKRAIQLSPEKTKEKIESLNKTIREWEEKSEQLGKVVQGLKASCLGVGAMLIVKNFFANTGGKAIARQNVMRGDGGINDMCADAINGKGEWASKGYRTLNECFTKESGFIDNMVNTYYDSLKKQNDEIKRLQKNFDTREFLTETHVDTEKFGKEYIPIVQEELSQTPEREIDVGGGEMVKVSEIINMITPDKVSIEQARSLQLNSRINSDMTNEQLDKGLIEIYVNNKDAAERSNFEKDSSDYVNNAYADSYGSKDSVQGIYRGATAKTESPFIGGEGTPMQLITFNNKKYYLELEEGGSDQYNIIEVYNEGGTLLSEDSTSLNYDSNVEKIKNRISSFKKYDTSSYENPYKDAKLSYYETEPYKGLPAIVPFDLERGWYASVSQTLPITGSIGSYDKSGRVSSLYVCNVGENGKEENKRGDDICQMINLGTGQPYNQFPGITDKNKALKIIGCAVDAVEDASKAHKSGVRRVRISTNCDNFYVDVGKPAVDIPDMQCQDFMSPKDCQLLFNVCDPVICPSSRCDFGGAYPVRDVIQSGIIGSIALCLPNIREGIYIPVCLTGIKAGIDGLISVFTSYRDCLQESLDTGKMVGICDEIYSIHLCEFFWRQTLPIANLVIPKMMEIVMGQNVRGGGEYLGVASAWSNAGKSVDYFTQYYAAESYASFKARIKEGISDAICDVFISGSYPEGGNLLESLTEPDSPPQFHGRFDEIPFTTTTVPPISHYKVYYHIYAGKESRAYYKVYLRSPPGSSFYQDTATVRFVDSGYIATGDYVSETPDFTAPSGYKQMCIMVNGQEECGFDQVSTSFAIDYIKDQYIKEQAGERDIKTETECIAGTVSAYSLLTPSIEGAADEIINPAIYNKGIIRVCATESPGKGTDPLSGMSGSRWIQVGNCDNENIKCWLDTESVESVVEFDISAEDVLEEQNEEYIKILMSEGNYSTREQVSSKIDEIRKKSTSEDKIKLIDEIFDKVFWNDQKAELLLLRGDAYGELAKAIKSVEVREEAVTEEEKEEYPVSEEEKEEYPVDKKLTCKQEIGKEIIEIAQSKKTNEDKFKDETVKADTGAKNFECLILMQAMQESNLQHCEEVREGDCLYCDKNGLDYLRSKSGEESYGVMQINIGERANPDMKDDVDDFDKNVEFGINYLIKYYNLNTKSYNCGGKNYKGWKRALRYYNGWNTDCSKGDINYVENVLGRRNSIISLFPECGDEQYPVDDYPVEYPIGTNYPYEVYPSTSNYPVVEYPIDEDYPVEDIKRKEELEKITLTEDANELKNKISESIDYRRANLDSVSSDIWAETIVKVMIKHDIPLEKEYVSLVASTIERESNFRKDPLVPNMKKVISRKIEEIESGSFVERWGGLKTFGAKNFYEKYEDDINKIKTEKQLEGFIDSVSWYEKPFIEGFRPETVGSMQLNVNKANLLAKKYYSEDFSDREMRAVLYTLNGGVDYGILSLKEIINAYTDSGKKSLDKDTVELIAADYQSGLYSSRNAALQKQLNELMRTNLVLDGDVGPKTLDVMENFLKREGKDPDLAKDDFVLYGSKEKGFENTDVYRLIKGEYKGKTEKEPEYAIIPSNVVSIAKYSLDITSERYVLGTYLRYLEYCKLLNC